jgi:hypothetical protein
VHGGCVMAVSRCMLHTRVNEDNKRCVCTCFVAAVSGDMALEMYTKTL